MVDASAWSGTIVRRRSARTAAHLDVSSLHSTENCLRWGTAPSRWSHELTYKKTRCSHIMLSRQSWLYYITTTTTTIQYNTIQYNTIQSHSAQSYNKKTRPTVHYRVSRVSGDRYEEKKNIVQMRLECSSGCRSTTTTTTIIIIVVIKFYVFISSDVVRH